jgi:hypothetical protein
MTPRVALARAALGGQTLAPPPPLLPPLSPLRRRRRVPPEVREGPDEGGSAALSPSTDALRWARLPEHLRASSAAGASPAATAAGGHGSGRPLAGLGGSRGRGRICLCVV